uniref:Uncharacterized protein n=1 Tax=Meloidogyne enterolobii TaxID=390850 RepID=A0A6V7X3E7_MELEN|nr:unnamed protein product [Meloidogyne enterolobii]
MKKIIFLIIFLQNISIFALPNPLQLPNSIKNFLCEILQEIKFCYNPLNDDVTFEILEKKYKFIFEADESQGISINRVTDQINILSNFYMMEILFKRYPEYKNSNIMK